MEMANSTTLFFLVELNRDFIIKKEGCAGESPLRTKISYLGNFSDSRGYFYRLVHTIGV
jgi:hypothetical protein